MPQKQFKGILYRFYDKDNYFDFMDKARRADLGFQSFVELAIKDYLEGNYNPKKEDEEND